MFYIFIFSSKYEINNRSFVTQAFSKDSYYISSFQFDKEDMEKLYEFLSNCEGFQAQVKSGLSEAIIIAIAIDYVLKRRSIHNLNRHIIHTNYVFNKNSFNYKSEIKLLSDEVSFYENFKGRLDGEIYGLLKKEVLPATSYNLENMILDKYAREIDDFLQIKRKYDLKCSEAILHCFKNSQAIIKETQYAIQKYQDEKPETIAEFKKYLISETKSDI